MLHTYITILSISFNFFFIHHSWFSSGQHFSVYIFHTMFTSLYWTGTGAVLPIYSLTCHPPHPHGLFYIFLLFKANVRKTRHHPWALKSFLRGVREYWHYCTTINCTSMELWDYWKKSRLFNRIKLWQRIRHSIHRN